MKCARCEKVSLKSRKIIAFIAGADCGLHPHGVPDAMVQAYNDALTEPCTCEPVLAFEVKRD